MVVQRYFCILFDVKWGLLQDKNLNIWIACQIEYRIWHHHILPLPTWPLTWMSKITFHMVNFSTWFFLSAQINFLLGRNYQLLNCFVEIHKHFLNNNSLFLKDLLKDLLSKGLLGKEVQTHTRAEAFRSVINRMRKWNFWLHVFTT